MAVELAAAKGRVEADLTILADARAAAAADPESPALRAKVLKAEKTVKEHTAEQKALEARQQLLLPVEAAAQRSPVAAYVAINVWLITQND